MAVLKAVQWKGNTEMIYKYLNDSLMASIGVAQGPAGRQLPDQYFHSQGKINKAELTVSGQMVMFNPKIL